MCFPVSSRSALIYVCARAVMESSIMVFLLSFKPKVSSCLLNGVEEERLRLI